VAPIAKDGKLDPLWPTVVKKRVDGGPDGAPSEEDVIDENHRFAAQVEVDVGGVYDRLGRWRLRAHIIPVEGDIEVPDWGVGTDQVVQQPMKPSRQKRTARVNSHDRQRIGDRILLRNLMSNPPKRSPQVIAL
jgi:hypothetical protein